MTEKAHIDIAPKKIRLYKTSNPEDKKVLEAKSERILPEHMKDVSDYIFRMIHFLRTKPDGLGLALPQVGQNKRGFITNRGKIMVFLNPEVIEVSKRTEEQNESCFSEYKLGVRIVVPVTRPKKVKLKRTDEAGRGHEERFSGKHARIIQHELDHLDGKLLSHIKPSLAKEMMKPMTGSERRRLKRGEGLANLSSKMLG